MRRETATSFIGACKAMWVMLGLLGILPAMFSVTMLDAPGADKRPATVILVWSLLTFPVACGLSVAMAGVASRAGNYGKGCLWAALPFVNLIAAACGSIWISLAQGGNFNG